MADTSTIPATPEGYWRNAAGHLVPEAQVSAHDKLRDGVARVNHELLDWLESLDTDPAHRVRARCGA